MCSQRARFATRGEMIGIGLKTMVRDDLVCVLYGAAVPFVIRPVTDGTGYILIGECYIYGLMSGGEVNDRNSLTNPVSGGRFQAEEVWIELR